MEHRKLSCDLQTGFSWLRYEPFAFACEHGDNLKVPQISDFLTG